MKHFKVLPNLLPKDDFRYKKWRKSLKKRPAPWNKGFTKENNESVAKISRTFKRKKINNFSKWRKKEIKEGRIRVNYLPFEKSGDLAELIGAILGDGHICKFPRTESLSIFSNANNRGFVNRYSKLIEKFFNKKPRTTKRNDSNCIKISIYQKEISNRLGIPSGSRYNKLLRMPDWILGNKEYIRRYLRGLYEAEGSFCVHEPTYTYKFMFANKNKSLLNNVYEGLEILGFHPHRTNYNIQISKKEEAYKAKEFLDFRKY